MPAANRSYSWNAYETELVSGVDASTQSLNVISSVGLAAPCYLVIDPDDALKREYIKVTAINVNILTAERGEAGSVGGTGIAHDAGAKVRAVPVHQWLNDIFDDIDAIDNSFANHEAAGDPHPVYLLEADADVTYLKLAGGTMAGTLILDSDPTPGGLEAATAQYAEAIASTEADEAEANANTYTDSAIDAISGPGGVLENYLPLSGAGIMEGALQMGGFSIGEVHELQGYAAGTLTLQPALGQSLEIVDGGGTRRFMLNDSSDDLLFYGADGIAKFYWDESAGCLRIASGVFIDMDGDQIRDMGEPTSNTHAATKLYVDSKTWDASDIASGVIADARLPSGSTTDKGIVQLANAIGTSTSLGTSQALANAIWNEAQTKVDAAGDTMTGDLQLPAGSEAGPSLRMGSEQTGFFRGNSTSWEFSVSGQSEVLLGAVVHDGGRLRNIRLQGTPPSAGDGRDGEVWIEY